VNYFGAGFPFLLTRPARRALQARPLMPVRRPPWFAAKVVVQCSRHTINKWEPVSKEVSTAYG